MLTPETMLGVLPPHKAPAVLTGTVCYLGPRKPRKKLPPGLGCSTVIDMFTGKVQIAEPISHREMSFPDPDSF